MLKSYLKFAWRNILKDRQYTFLNLIGLSTGLACSLLIYLWVNDELKVNRFHEKDGRIYQVMVNAQNSNGIETIPQTPSLLADAKMREQ
jgi:putative ABC transport system permease protein